MSVRDNTIVSRAIFDDSDDSQLLMGQHRVGMLKNKYNRLARKYNFAFYTGEEIINSVRQMET
jgi:hypothetical protein